MKLTDGIAAVVDLYGNVSHVSRHTNFVSTQNPPRVSYFQVLGAPAGAVAVDAQRGNPERRTRMCAKHAKSFSMNSNVPSSRRAKNH